MNLLEKDVSQILQNNLDDEVAKTAFSMDVRQHHILLKSNLLPVVLYMKWMDMSFVSKLLLSDMPDAAEVIGIAQTEMSYTLDCPGQVATFFSAM